MIDARHKIRDESPTLEGDQEAWFVEKRAVGRPEAPTIRPFEIVLAGVLLAFTLPLLLCVALAIKWEGPGPILEKQACIGRGGRRFQMLRFRTTESGQRWIPTRMGEFLRYTRMEDLPQLINVLRGDASLFRL